MLIDETIAQGDETAYLYKEQRHGMFTYYLLKKLQETKGEATLGEISDYVTSEVRKQSIVINGNQAISAQLMQEDAQLHVENNLMALFNEMTQLKEAMRAYDVPLMYRSLDLLKQALTEGQISLIEYFVEAETVYKNLQAYMKLENQYQKVMADI